MRIELLATDTRIRGHNVAKLLLGAASRWDHSRYLMDLRDSSSRHRHGEVSPSIHLHNNVALLSGELTKSIDFANFSTHIFSTHVVL